jgi:hypothetical protein
LQQLNASPETSHIPNPDDPEKLFKDLNGKHRMVFDVIEPVWIFPLCLAQGISSYKRGYRHTRKENSVVVVLRHSSIPMLLKTGFGTNTSLAISFM